MSAEEVQDVRAQCYKDMLNDSEVNALLMPKCNMVKNAALKRPSPGTSPRVFDGMSVACKQGFVTFCAFKWQTDPEMQNLARSLPNGLQL